MTGPFIDMNPKMTTKLVLPLASTMTSQIQVVWHMTSLTLVVRSVTSLIPLIRSVTSLILVVQSVTSLILVYLSKDRYMYGKLDIINQYVYFLCIWCSLNNLIIQITLWMIFVTSKINEHRLDSFTYQNLSSSLIQITFFW